MRRPGFQRFPQITHARWVRCADCGKPTTDRSGLCNLCAWYRYVEQEEERADQARVRTADQAALATESSKLGSGAKVPAPSTGRHDGNAAPASSARDTVQPTSTPAEGPEMPRSSRGLPTSTSTGGRP